MESGDVVLHEAILTRPGWRTLAAMSAIDLFHARFGGEPTLRARAPGRVNLIGEHTDYQGGFVFPIAIDREIEVVARPTDGPTRLVSDRTGDGAPFDARTAEPGTVEGWAKYVAATAWAMRREHPVTNIEAAVVSTVPMGSGVSSSAALEISFAHLFARLAGREPEAKPLALHAQYGENEFVGNKCGIMDQTASAAGVEGHALFIDTASLEISPAPLPPGTVVVLLDTGVARAADDWRHYNARRAACERASRALGVKWLRDAGPEDVRAKAWMLGPETARRALHVTGENARCLAFRDALAASNADLAGTLMRASHESLRDDYAVSTPELDAMAESAWASPGVVGARLTGAGFGGACVALVREESVAEFQKAVLQNYQVRTNREGTAMVCRAVQGGTSGPV